MKVEITGTSVSKKGTVWLQVKLVEGETPRTGEVFNCEPVKPVEVKEPVCE